MMKNYLKTQPELTVSYVQEHLCEKRLCVPLSLMVLWITKTHYKLRSVTLEFAKPQINITCDAHFQNPGHPLYRSLKDYMHTYYLSAGIDFSEFIDQNKVLYTLALNHKTTVQT